jgi:hypothetical protein
MCLKGRTLSFEIDWKVVVLEKEHVFFYLLQGTAHRFQLYAAFAEYKEMLDKWRITEGWCPINVHRSWLNGTLDSSL